MSPFAVLILIAVPIVLVLGYLHWRSVRSEALHALRSGAPLRRLSEAERAAFAPIRAITGAVHDDQVRRLSGALDPGSAAAIGDWPLHRILLAGVEAVLPFDGWRHLATDNHAEVVMAGDVAWVVRVNGFHIVGAQGRCERHRAREEAALEPAPTAPRPPRARALVASQPSGDRLESTAEVALRRSGGLRWGGLMVALVALWSLFLGPDTGSTMGWLALNSPAIIAGGIAALRVIPRGRGPAGPLRVIQIPGVLYRLHLHPRCDGIWLIGTDRQVVVPPEWAHSGRFDGRPQLTLEVRETDGAVLAAGPHWSLAEDRHAFPPSGIVGSLAWLALLLGVLATSAVPFPGIEGIAASLARLHLPSVAGALWWPVIAAALVWQCLHVARKAWQVVRRDAARRITFERRPAPGH